MIDELKKISRDLNKMILNIPKVKQKNPYEFQNDILTQLAGK